VRSCTPQPDAFALVSQYPLIFPPGLREPQQSTVRPDTIHADTQGQALPVNALAHLCGFELMPRVRNWKDLNFYRPTPASRFRHIEALFGEPGRNVIDWDLIERHYDDLMRVVLSVAAGKISSVTFCRPIRGATTSTRRSARSAGSSGPSNCCFCGI
jgi:TnpA family transposase